MKKKKNRWQDRCKGAVKSMSSENRNTEMATKFSGITLTDYKILSKLNELI